MKDICLNCGKEHTLELWGAKCDCDNPNVVHRRKCDNKECKNIIGYIIDDDYVGLDKLYCSECLLSIKEKRLRKLKKLI